MFLVLASCHGSSVPGADASAPVSTLGADAEAIALDGAQLPRLLHAMPDRIAAFSWTAAGFVEVPVQIDQREVRPFSDAMSPDDPRRDIATAVTTSFYTDSNLAPGDGTTYVGADHDPTFDSDDELVVLAKDFGGAAPDGSFPDAVDASTRTMLHATIGTASTREGFVYLFVRTNAPTQFAPAVAMSVAFIGETGDFKSFYRSNASDLTGTSRGCGGGAWGIVYPEDTTITAATYVRHFTGRWMSDELRIVGQAPHLDLLDVAEVRPAFASMTGDVAQTIATPLPLESHACDRSTTSFSGGPGTFVTLRQGPIRAIRSYYGANSGTITERTHLFYPAREDIYTFLRVHPIAGAGDGLDLSAAAIGMTYYNEHNLGGIPIDGVPDTYDRTFARWELVTGASQGSVLSVHRKLLVDLGPLSTTAYAPQTMFLDQGSDATCVCSGDDTAYIGAHGPQILTPGTSLPNTDPIRGDAGEVLMWRSLYPAEANLTPDAAAAHADDVQTLVISVDDGPAFDPSAVVCGDGVCEVDETSSSCPADCPPVPGASRCGDHTCVDGEQFLCLADCPLAGHADYFSCLATTCYTDYFSCGSDPGCAAGLTCIENCTDTYASCLQTCSATITDQGSRDLAGALVSCGAAACAGMF
jgi:hypothetical protein